MVNLIELHARCCRVARGLLVPLYGRSPRALRRRIWQRCKTKVSEERKPASNASRSSSESVRTKMGGFMTTTGTHCT